jgi:RHS repeat-associated protein
VLNHITYDSFGNVTSETNPSVDFRYGYTGREHDEEIGLTYYRARYYDPATGRFIGEDPIGFRAGDTNIYRYVGNSPLNGTDPTGLWGEGIGKFFTDGARSYLDAGRRLVQNPGQTLNDAFEGAKSLINEKAEDAQKYYAERLNDPKTPGIMKPGLTTLGLLSSLATECNLPKTATVLGTALLATQSLKSAPGKFFSGKLSEAGIGAGLGSGFETTAQLIKNRGDFNKLDYGQIGISGGTGYLGGSLSPVASQGKTILSRAFRNTLIGAGGGAVDKIVKNACSQNPDIFSDVGKSALAGGIASGTGSVAGDKFSKLFKSPQRYTRELNNQQQYFRGLSVPQSFYGSAQQFSKEIPDYSASSRGANIGSNISKAISGLSSFVP